MTREEYFGIRLNEFFDGIDKGDFRSADAIPDTYHFDILEALFYYSEQLEGSEDLYRQLFHMVNEKGWNAVRRKIASGQKVKVTFLAISAAEWPTDELYTLLEQDGRFDVSVSNVPLVDRNIDDRIKTYSENREFFLAKGYKVLETYDVETDKVYSWQELNEEPDIVIHVSCWFESMPICYRISHFPLSRVNLQVAYGFATGNSTNGKFIYSVSSNKEIFNMLNVSYVNSQKDLVRFRKHQFLKGENIAYSGYSKMDYFYRGHEYSEEKIRSIWKIPEGKKPADMKKVIVAPHHSFLGYAGIKFSTFAQNAHFWLYLAEKYQNEICFMFKPHPNLRYRAVEAKVFETAELYDEYISRWEALPNAKVVVEGDYLEAFDTSDAMIMDSISFLAEYMYTQKPVLYLRRPEQVFSELGQLCLDTYEQANGYEYSQIEEFLVNVVLNGQDTLKEKREAVYREYLDYQSDNGCLASEYIYQDIVAKISD